MNDLGLGRLAVLVPVKSFADAKVRLAGALPPVERAELARRMANHVLDVASPLPAAVVCDDAEVAAWARDRGVLVVWAPGQGLNRAVEVGVDHLGGLGVERVIVAHADLPLAGPLGWAGGVARVTLVAHRRDDRA